MGETSENHDPLGVNEIHSINDCVDYVEDTSTYAQFDGPRKAPWYKYITIEPVILLYSFAITLTAPVGTTMYLTHTCRNFGYNETDCEQLEGTAPKSLEALVQPEVNILKMYEMLVETGLPAVLTLFIGPWSDLYGRKTFIIAPIIGNVVKYAMLLTMSFYPTLPPAYLLFASIPVSLSGGMISVISMCYCYITDVSEKHRRGFRMGIVEASFYSGLLLGTLNSTILFEKTKYLGIFTLSFSLCFAAIVHGLFWVAESVEEIKNDSPFRNFFRIGLVREMFEVCCKKRGPKQRTIVFLVIFSLASSVLTMEGEGSVQFLFTRKKFSWDIAKYMVFASANLVLQIIGTLSAVSIFSAWLGMSDSLIASLSFALKTMASILLGISTNGWWMYLAAAVGMFGSCGGPLSRAIVSKTVEPQDVGKVFSMVTAVEALTPLAAGPLYAFIYNETMLTFPGAFYLLSASIFTVDFVILGVVTYIQKYYTTEYSSVLSR